MKITIDRNISTIPTDYSWQMGLGNDELGTALMKGFIYALGQQDVLPKTILFYNGGAALTCQDSASLEDLKSMEAQGVELVAMESAIALGLPLFRGEFDAVLAVDAPRELRLERACRRDGASREAVQARMDAQNVDLSSADAVIVNDGSEEDLPVRVDAALAAIGGDIFELYNQVKKDKNMKTDLARILSVSGKHGLYQYVAPSRGGAIAEALSDKTRTAFDAKSRITTLEDIAIYTSEGEMKLREVFLALQSVLGEADAPTSKASADELKDLFGKAVPDYDADRFYVSHMKKVVDWYNELKNFASLDFVNPDEEQAGEETSNE